MVRRAHLGSGTDPFGIIRTRYAPTPNVAPNVDADSMDGATQIIRSPSAHARISSGGTSTTSVHNCADTTAPGPRSVTCWRNPTALLGHGKATRMASGT